MLLELTDKYATFDLEWIKDEILCENVFEKTRNEPEEWTRFSHQLNVLIEGLVLVAFNYDISTDDDSKSDALINCKPENKRNSQLDATFFSHTNLFTVFKKKKRKKNKWTVTCKYKTEKISASNLLSIFHLVTLCFGFLIYVCANIGKNSKLNP